MNYRSVANLNNAMRKWSEILPLDINIIIGVPRSGLLAANLLALHRNLPLGDFYGFLDGKILSSGKRSKGCDTSILLRKDAKILIVDDSILTGNEMRRIKSLINKEDLPYQICFGAVYVTEKTSHLVDYWYEEVDLPRIFEWNMMHHAHLERTCVDIDGVLCRDPAEAENDDDVQYINFLSNVEPRCLPSLPIGWLVTCRLEKYRQATEQWLKKHSIQYRNLIMMQHPSKEARVAAGNRALYKARVYQETRAILFIESSFQQATEMVRITGKPVYCTDVNKMMYPGRVVELTRQPWMTLKKLLKRIYLLKVARSILARIL